MVSDRATSIPGMTNCGIRQTVVRISSVQSKDKIVNGEAEPSTTKQVCNEYIVIQQMCWNGKDEPWRIWGHTSPTTVKDLENPAFAPGMSMYDRIQAIKGRMA